MWNVCVFRCDLIYFQLIGLTGTWALLRMKSHRLGSSWACSRRFGLLASQLSFRTLCIDHPRTSRACASPGIHIPLLVLGHLWYNMVPLLCRLFEEIGWKIQAFSLSPGIKHPLLLRWEAMKVRTLCKWCFPLWVLPTFSLPFFFLSSFVCGSCCCYLVSVPPLFLSFFLLAFSVPLLTLGAHAFYFSRTRWGGKLFSSFLFEFNF